MVAAAALIHPLLQFLNETNNSFYVKFRPYDLYVENHQFGLEFAIFRENQIVEDHGNQYTNLFDAMIDSVVTALTVVGHADIPVVVIETGWPNGPAGFADATSEVVALYINGLIRHLHSGLGSPLRKEGVLFMFVYQLFDGDLCWHLLWHILLEPDQKSGREFHRSTCIWINRRPAGIRPNRRRAVYQRLAGI